MGAKAQAEAELLDDVQNCEVVLTTTIPAEILLQAIGVDRIICLNDRLSGKWG
jgi:hypothetical protein